MKCKKCHFILGVVCGVLCVAASGQAAVPEPDEPMLIAPANPALAGIKVLNVVVAIRPAEKSKNGLDNKTLKTRVERVLEKAGIRIFVPKEGVTYDMDISSDLKVAIEILELGDSQQPAVPETARPGRCVFRAQTSLSRGVCLVEQRNLAFKADVWTAEPVMQMEQVRNVSDKVTEAVLAQVDGFIQAYRIANPVTNQTSVIGDTTAISPVEPKEQSKLARETTATEYKYMASKNSQVFHKPNCRSAKRISPENIVVYKNRDEAIKAGKRPCKVCSP